MTGSVSYDPDIGASPLMNFDTFLNSMTTTFVMLTNDGQSQIFYSFYRSVSPSSSLSYWMSFIIIAQKILLTVFIAILLQNFDAGMMKGEIFDQEKEKTEDIMNLGRKTRFTFQEYLKMLWQKLLEYIEEKRETMFLDKKAAFDM